MTAKLFPQAFPASFRSGTGEDDVYATLKNIKQNLFFAFIYNSLGIPVADGILYPWFSILLSPIIAAAAMSISSVSVVTNALQLRKVNL